MSIAAIAWSVTPRDGGQFWGQRMALTSAEDVARGFFVQGALKAIRELGDESLVTRCTSASGQSRFFDFFSYPIRLQLQMLSAAMPALAARHGDVDQALWLMGHCVAMDFLESEAGRTVQVLVRGETKRLVNNLALTYRMSLTGERQVKWTGPQCCRFTMKRDFLPVSFHEGMLVAMLERMNASKVKVVGHQMDVLDSEYDISWQ
ncbi:TIGR02265 family protein [Vitiosangium sp. GDMCC 1.1324]|uniref:TIGR02265 family protein n=1 Tax=Vitiosangium sp. (strain GDMCC 1.1324) TaxID=2138576 RepID=UPI000D362A89|nr:TIGR02265 family protein [Vitiosangium sp. GDMCC 1.1324]PTL84146.1 TIGR02265 family protein [Vitiosangium sp. GDMCC 1.1324]